MSYRVLAAGLLTSLLLASALVASQGASRLLAGGGAGGSTQTFLISPTGLEFGVVTVGNTSPAQVVTITNVSNAPVVGDFAGGSPGAPFNATQSCNGVTLNPGASCQINATFLPTVPGDFTGASSGTMNGQPFNVMLHGIGAPRFLISPTALEFGEVDTGGASPAQVVTITNVSNAPVVGDFAGGAPSAPFNATQSCNGVMLNPGASCQINATFLPTVPGDFTGASSGTMNGQPFNIALHGRTPGFVATATRTPTARSTATTTATPDPTATATPSVTATATATPTSTATGTPLPPRTTATRVPGAALDLAGEVRA